ncbi:DUF6787 family protein [Leeuwenhoekiella polynyae]|uniref:DUF6787 domain-containing protein n=1 Tax=Leeuwenhoekiella polynyae TaxID=1550906 RepID=A0A4V1KQG0_9FLAO|nr:DUF6787 family protein [Leeuwenhoekiella polynyae]RXG21282.1 hypothetical protein DSM02_2137 [Leeuwenhoekiella polynyae]
MKNFKDNWEITRNWQLIYPILGVLLALGCGYLIAARLDFFFESDTMLHTSYLVALTILITYLILKISLLCFKKLKNRWILEYRWQFIAVFMVFAITGSTAGRISSPVMNAIGLGGDSISGWVYWPLRILIIFPIYQVLLLVVAWIFGQYKFFYAFEKKMLSRMGLGFLFTR